MPINPSKIQEYRSALIAWVSNSSEQSATLEICYIASLEQPGKTKTTALSVDCESKAQRDNILAYLVDDSWICTKSGSNDRRFYVLEAPYNELEPKIEPGERSLLHGFNNSLKHSGHTFKDLTGNLNWVDSMPSWRSSHVGITKVMSRGSSEREIILLDFYDRFWNDTHNQHITDATNVTINTAISITRQLLPNSADIDNAKKTEEINAPILLSTIVKQGNGICRHHAPTCAYFLTRLIQEKKLNDGKIYHVRNNIDKKRAHTIVLYIPKSKGACWYFDSLNEDQAYNLMDANDKESLIKKWGDNDDAKNYINKIFTRYHIDLQRPTECQVMIKQGTSKPVIKTDAAYIRQQEKLAIGYITADINFLSSDFEANTFRKKPQLASLLEGERNQDKFLFIAITHVLNIKNDKDEDKVRYLWSLQPLGDLKKKLKDLESRIDSDEIKNINSKMGIKKF
ncbi:MAG: hypothetical protein WC748_08060 [Legionellales bacterium]|jgi:hypothetical protein